MNYFVDLSKFQGNEQHFATTIPEDHWSEAPQGNGNAPPLCELHTHKTLNV